MPRLQFTSLAIGTGFHPYSWKAAKFHAAGWPASSPSLQICQGKRIIVCKSSSFMHSKQNITFKAFLKGGAGPGQKYKRAMLFFLFLLFCCFPFCVFIHCVCLPPMLCFSFFMCFCFQCCLFALTVFMLAFVVSPSVLFLSFVCSLCWFTCFPDLRCVHCCQFCVFCFFLDIFFYGGLRPPGPRHPSGSTTRHNFMTKSILYQR